MAVSNGTGKGGKSFQDRQKAAEVRASVLECLSMIIADDPKVETWSEYKKDIIRRMSNSILPRLNEHTGEDGQPLVIKFDSAFTSKTERDS